MDIGYFTISRKLKDNFLYPKNERRKFTKYEAWIYLIEKAYYFCCEKFIDNKKVIIPRGYFDCTIEQISDELNWDRRTTEKFLKMLESEQQIKRFKISKSRKSCTLVKVNNYNAFQLPNDDICKLKCKLKCKSYCTLQCKLGCTPNKELKESKTIKVSKFIKPTIEQIQDYCIEKNNNIDVEYFYNHYESNGWKVGRNKMKDWKATVNQWISREKKRNNNNIATIEDGYSL